ncbi:MAG: Glutamate/aspartate import solute-binding protein [Sodalis sp.]|nr:MAG: Glutamate/aspartate import solute-binding protein [Sodalis sp.]
MVAIRRTTTTPSLMPLKKIDAPNLRVKYLPITLLQPHLAAANSTYDLNAAPLLIIWSARSNGLLRYAVHLGTNLKAIHKDFIDLVGKTDAVTAGTTSECCSTSLTIRSSEDAHHQHQTATRTMESGLAVDLDDDALLAPVNAPNRAQTLMDDTIAHIRPPTRRKNGAESGLNSLLT